LQRNAEEKVMSDNYFVFREIRSLNELQTLLSLRYQVYRESNLKYFIEENEYGIDLDNYDFHSRHFGLFENNLEPIGYMRVVENGLSPQFEKLQDILKKHPQIAPKVSMNPKIPFPSMVHWGNEIKKVYQKIKDNNGDLVEGSRYVLKQNIKSIILAKLILESAFAIYLFYYSDYAIVSCTPAHKRFYSRYGFSTLTGTLNREFDGFHGCCLLGSASNVPNSQCKKLQQMANAYKNTGQICYNPSNPEIYYEPMGSHHHQSNIYCLAA